MVICDQQKKVLSSPEVLLEIAINNKIILKVC